MGLDGELTGILREVVQFLECLREVKLPIALESIRENLLVRSKDTLTMSMLEKRMEMSTSPEPYLDMNAAGPRGLLAASKTEAELEEYVRAEERWSQKQQQHHYETFQTVESTTDSSSATNPETGRGRNKQEQSKNMLMDIYASFSAAQAMSKCHKCGPLYRKEGKKLFVFEQYRACWVGLVGLHFLIYGNDRDNRPCTILPIRGYMARAAPNAVPRDQRKSESAFEIFRPGSRTFQFVARSPQDMEQWVMKICELNGEEKNENKEHPKTLVAVAFESDASQSDSRQDSNCREELYQDVGSLLADKAVLEDSSMVVNVSNGDGETAHKAAASPRNEPSVEIAKPSGPPLPARIPRRLPVLPVHGSSSSYQCPGEEEDDIYHKIEDFKDSIHCYGNVGKTFETKSLDHGPEELPTYDDVCARAKDESKSEEKPKKKKNSKKKNNSESTTRRSIDSRNGTIYDNTTSTSIAGETNNIAIIDEQDKLVSYNEVENFLSNVRSAKSHGTEKTEKTVEPVKSSQKKSFLDRVRSRKESPQKIEKKIKRTVAMALPATVQELATYDDVSNFITVEETKRNFEAEYTCPPPPRPIYKKSPTIVTNAIEQQEFYDDVSSCRENVCKDEDACILDQRTPRKLNYVPDASRVDADTFVLCENTGYSQQPFDDNEHYKIPRSEPNHHRKYLTADQHEELYDDVAILADFTARQKEVLGKRDGEDATRIQAGSEKRSRNRFVRGFQDADDFDEQHGLMRMNTFQKLINKMENSLGKASVKIAPSMLLNKTNVTNDS